MFEPAERLALPIDIKASRWLGSETSQGQASLISGRCCAPRPPCIDLIDPARASPARAGASLARDADGWLGSRATCVAYRSRVLPHMPANDRTPGVKAFNDHDKSTAGSTPASVERELADRVAPNEA
jgi:hypothetical protein